MPIQMTIEVKGRPQLMRKLKRAGIDVSDMSEPLKDIGNFLKKFYAGDVFDSQGNEIGEPWKPLNVKYRKRKQVGIGKRKLGIAKGPLELTGKMRDSFYSRVGRNKVEVGNKMDYFKYHQLGTKNIPARRMLKLDKRRKEKVVDIFENHLERRLKRTWR